MPRIYESMEHRIIANSVQTEEHGMVINGLFSFCWVWIGRFKLNRSGMRYPVINTRFKKGPRKGKVKSEGAHRVSLRVFKGRIIGRKVVVMHKCDNSLCVNPEHLAGGRQRTNMRDMVRKGRHRNQYSPFMGEAYKEAA